MNLVAIVKGNERYIYHYDETDLGSLAVSLSEQAENEELSINHKDIRQAWGCVIQRAQEAGL